MQIEGCKGPPPIPTEPNFTTQPLGSSNINCISSCLCLLASFQVRKKTMGCLRLYPVWDSSLDAVPDVTRYDLHGSFERSNYHPHFADEISEVQNTTGPASHCESGRAGSQTLG